jgi:hypothetical protein
MFFIYLIGCVALQVWVWRRLMRRLRAHALTRLQCILHFSWWALLPIVVFVGGFALLVWIEELLDVALIEERSVLLGLRVIGLSVVGTFLFAVRCALART